MLIGSHTHACTPDTRTRTNLVIPKMLTLVQQNSISSLWSGLVWALIGTAAADIVQILFRKW